MPIFSLCSRKAVASCGIINVLLLGEIALNDFLTFVCYRPFVCFT